MPNAINAPLVIYKSSAGSGKTYTLVREILKLLLENPLRYRKILALTFTNKATNEMKKRLLSALSEISDSSIQPEDHSLKSELINHFKDKWHTIQLAYNPVANAKEFVEKQATRVLSLLLHEYSNLNINTIDSFFQKVLRFFIQEIKVKNVNIPMRYELDMDADKALEEVVANLLKDIGTINKETEQFNSWIEEFVFFKMENNEGWDIERAILGIGKQIFNEDIYNLQLGVDDEVSTEQIKQYLEDLNEIRKYSLTDKLRFEKDLKDTIEALIDKLNENGINIQAFRSIKKGVNNIVYNKEYNVLNDKEFSKTFYNSLKHISFASKNQKDVNLKIQSIEGIQDIIDAFFNIKETRAQDYYTALAILKNIFTFGLLNKLRLQLREYRVDKNVVLISDTNKIVNTLIGDNDISFVFEKVGTKYEHIMLDEFQDTSKMQWENLKPLLQNSLSSGNFNLIVGDVKQSIYRWRGGDMELLLNRVKKQLKPILPRNYNPDKNLKDNYRSNKNIVQFNNNFFEKAIQVLSEKQEGRSDEISNLEFIKDAYSDIGQQAKAKAGGYVEVNFFTSPNKKISGYKDAAKAHVVNTIKKLIGEGYKYKDICLLTKKNADGNILAEHLSKHNISVISSESLLLKNSPKVKLLINLMVYLINPDDDIARTAALQNYQIVIKDKYKNQADNNDVINEIINLPEHKIFTDFEQYNANRLQKDDSEKQLSYFEKWLPKSLLNNPDAIIRKPLYEISEFLLQALQLDEVADAYIQRFQDLMLHYNLSISNNLSEFLEWWEEHKEKKETSVLLPEGENAVTIMTIHKAKGLEFPIVMLPFADWSLSPKTNGIFWGQAEHPVYGKLGMFPLSFTSALKHSHFENAYHTELVQGYLDNINALYVAFTRPKNRLYINTTISKTDIGPLSDKNASAYTKALQKNIKKYPKKISSLLALCFLYDTNNNPFFKDNIGQYTYKEDSINVKWGTKKEAHADNKNKSESSLSINQYISEDYRIKIKIGTASKRFFTLLDNTKSQAIKKGLYIHAVLEKINHPKDLPHVLTSLQNKGIIPKSAVPAIKESIENILIDDRFKKWFPDINNKQKSWQILSERVILDHNNQYIPDRVLINEQKKIAMLLDYKTGKQENKHIRQIHQYAKLLEHMNYKVVEKALLYIGDNNYVVNL